VTSIDEFSSGSGRPGRPDAALRQAERTGEIALRIVEAPDEAVPTDTAGMVGRAAVVIVAARRRRHACAAPEEWAILPWVRAWSRHTRVTIRPAGADDYAWAVTAARACGRAALVVAADAAGVDAWAAALAAGRVALPAAAEPPAEGAESPAEGRVAP
jgi:hypothetical protein